MNKIGGVCAGEDVVAVLEAQLTVFCMVLLDILTKIFLLQICLEHVQNEVVI